MTQPIPGAPSVKDFTRKHERLVFRIDDDLFEAAPALPGEALCEFAKRFSDIDNAPMAQRVDVIADALALVLLPDSHAVFAKRFRDLTNPIEYEQAAEVVEWLMGVYGKRPTEPSSPSSTGPASPVSGTSSTDVQQPAGSIPATFQAIAS
jgi:hypothetical protein